jgi:quinol monooxygenase YgiN
MSVEMLEMDRAVTYREQFGRDVAGPVVLINKFSVADPVQVDAFVANWTESAHHMKEQPGFISLQFHRGVGGSNTFLNYARWDSIGALANAGRTPGFQRILSQMPDSVSSMPHVFQMVDVPGVCSGI